MVVDRTASSAPPDTPPATELERALRERLDEQGCALAELRALVQVKPAADDDDTFDANGNAEGPFAPHYRERDGAVQNPPVP